MLALRLFSGDGEPERNRHGLSPRMRLSEFYREYALPVCLEQKGAAAGTVKQYNETLGFWAAFTGDPSIEQISERTNAEFVKSIRRLPAHHGRKPPAMEHADWLWSLTRDESGPRITTNTIAKHCRHIQRLLYLTGPCSRRNKLGAGLVDRVPWFDPPAPERDDDVEAFSFAEVEIWLDACREATLPKQARTGVLPSAWWQALILFLYNTAVRIGTAQVLEWSWLRTGDTPQGAILRVPPAGIKCHHGRLIYCNQAAVDAIAPLRGSRQKVFGFPGWPKSESYLQRLREELQEKAGLPAERRLGFHALRKLACTTIIEQTHDVGIAQRQLGHQRGSMVTIGNYTQVKASGPALEALPQPKRGRRRDNPLQRRLFE